MDGKAILARHFGVVRGTDITPNQELWSDRLMCLRRDIDAAIAEAVAREREACALLALEETQKNWNDPLVGTTARLISEHIRARRTP